MRQIRRQLANDALRFGSTRVTHSRTTTVGLPIQGADCGIAARSDNVLPKDIRQKTRKTSVEEAKSR